MRFLRAALVVGWLVLGAGCHCGVRVQAAPFVAVREKVLRSDDYALPLDVNAEKPLLSFLAAGGNRDDIGINIVYPDVAQKYQPLLDKLTNPENLDPDDLVNGTYASWFGGQPVRQIVDARSDRPPADDPPFALNDGRFWWIFYRSGQPKLSKMIVFKAIDRVMQDPR